MDQVRKRRIYTPGPASAGRRVSQLSDPSVIKKMGKADKVAKLRLRVVRLVGPSAALDPLCEP